MKNNSHQSQAHDPESSIPSVIGFRLDEEYARRLRERAERLGASVPYLCRAYLVGLLSESEPRQNVIYQTGKLGQEWPEARN